jgi:catechol 2,3-dioxygenase-like lactoylglutathione lyase family enzyme
MDVRFRIHHVALRARDVEATASFYRAVLGLAEVRAGSPESVWLGLADDAVLMVEALSPGEPTIPDGSMELLAFRVGEEEKRAVRDTARARGCFDGETEHTVYLRDPDGRRIGVSTHPLLRAG